MRRVAVGVDRGEFVDAELVLDRARRRTPAAPRGHGGLERRGHVVDLEGDRLHAVAVPDQALRRRGGRPRSGEASTNVISPWRST